MKKIYTTLVLLIFLITTQPIQIKAQAITSIIEVIDLSEYSILDLAQYYSIHYGIDYTEFYSVGMCESGWKPDNSGDNGLANNVLQIHKATFDRWTIEMGESLDYNSTIDHIKVGAWAFSQGESYKDDWTAYRAIQNGGTYKFYSKLLNKNYSVSCSLQDIT